MWRKFFDWLAPDCSGERASVTRAVDAVFWAENAEAMMAALDAKVAAREMAVAS